MNVEKDTVTIEVTVGIVGKDCEKTIQRTYSKVEWDAMRYA